MSAALDSLGLTDDEYNKLVANGAKDDEIVGVARLKSQSLGNGGKLPGEMQQQNQGFSVANAAVPTSGNKAIDAVMAGVKTALPIGAIEDVANMARQGKLPERPISDIAQLGSMALPGGMSTALAAGATSGAQQALGSAGVPYVNSAPARAILPFLAGMKGAQIGAPSSMLAPVEKGQEINALGRTASEMGIPIGQIQPPATQGLSRFLPGNLGSRPINPEDINRTWSGAVNNLGTQVGATKPLALQTNASTPDIITALQTALSKGMTGPGIMNIAGQPIPALSRSPEALNLIQQRASAAMDAAQNLPPQQAMEGLNNALEGLKQTVAESGEYGPNLAGKTATTGAGAWQGALDALAADPNAVVAHNAANQAFRKAATLNDLVQAASSKMVGASPSFDPRRFAFAWQNLEPGIKDSVFSPQEQGAINQLTLQDPNSLQRLAGKVADIAADYGIKPLAVIAKHPNTRFYEASNPYLTMGNALPSIAPAARSAGYNPAEDQDTQALAAKAASLANFIKGK